MLGKQCVMGHIAYEIPDDLHRRAKALASAKGQTFKAWITFAIREEVERQERDRREQERRRRSR